MLLTLLGTGQGTAVVGINVSDVIQRTLPSLNAYSLTTVAYWTEAELYGYADQAVKRLARLVGMFTERDTVTVVGGTAAYTLPTRHLSTIHASLGGANLWPAQVKDLEALDSTWQTSGGAVTKYVPGFLGTEQVRLYKTPAAGGTLALLFYQYPADVAVGSPVLTAPSVLEDYLGWAIIAEARAKEGDAQMLEAAKHAEERLRHFEQIFLGMWGTAK